MAPNFYGFLNQMGVKAPLGIQRFYYIAYPTGLLVAFGVYYFSCLVSAPEGMEKFGWKEPKDYFEEDDPMRGDSLVIEGVEIEKGVMAASKEV